jgi:hypothetical protein
LDEAELDGIEHSYEHNRNGSSCRFQGYGYLRAEANEQIGLEGDEFGRESWYALGMALVISVVNDQVLALDPAVIAQTLVEHFEELQILEAAEQADPARGPLRSRMPQANEQRRSRSYELPPLHSILIAA